MSTFLAQKNISLYTLPISWILCLAPRLYAAHLYTTTTSKPIDLLLPRALAARATADPVLETSIRDRIVRAEAAQANGLENVGFFAAAVVAGNVAGLSKTLLNSLSLAYLASRVLYNWLYVVGDTKRTALARTVVFFVGQGVLFSLFVLAGNSIR